MSLKVVIANSVGIDNSGMHIIHSPSRWTTSVRSNPFVWYPWQLAYLSSLLKRDTDADVKFVDGCLEQLDAERYIKKILPEKPDFMVMESSTRTIVDDLAVASEIRNRLGTKIIMTGQHPSVFPEEVLESADYVCIGEYELTVLDIIRGEDPSKIPGLYPNPRRPIIEDINILPWPEDTDIRRIDYGKPGVPGTNYLEVQMYASRGCPLSCDFCVCSNIYYGKPNWRPRDIQNVMDEISCLKEKYPEMEGVFFDEETHNTSPKRFDELLDAIIERGHNDLHYVAMGSYSSLNRDLIRKMKRAGYYQMRVGIETASSKIAETIGLGNKFDLNKLREALECARDEGLEMYGTFLFGAHGSSREEDMKTIELMKDIVKNRLLTELQVSIATPQPGTPFFNWADKNGFLVTKNWADYDGTCGSVINYPHYSKAEIDEMFQTAVDIGRFYRGMQEARREGYLAVFKRARNRVGISGIFLLLIRMIRGRIQELFKGKQTG